MKWLRAAANVGATLALACAGSIVFARLPIEQPAVLAAVSRLCRSFGVVSPEDIEMIELALVFGAALVIAGLLVRGVNLAWRRAGGH